MLEEFYLHIQNKFKIRHIEGFHLLSIKKTPLLMIEMGGYINKHIYFYL